MASFVKDTKINDLLVELVKEAEEQLVLFCPYFKLHDHLKDSLKLRVNDYHLRIIVVFGKNEHDPSKSLHFEDFEFLKSFPSVDIAYEKRLHAKYYANEKRGIITSLNLHTYSQNNNIEVGVLFSTKNLLKNLTDITLGRVTSIISDTEDLATEANDFFLDVFTNAEKIYQKEPRFKSNLISRKYTHSDVILDKTEWLFSQMKEKQIQRNTIGFNIPNSQYQTTMPKHGFCIRTKEVIALNPARPLSRGAYQSWAEFGNPDYRERYCHCCGKNFSTSVRNPLCHNCLDIISN